MKVFDGDVPRGPGDRLGDNAGIYSYLHQVFPHFWGQGVTGGGGHVWTGVGVLQP